MKNIIKISLVVVIGMTAMVSCNSSKNTEGQATDSTTVIEDNTDVAVDSTAIETPLPSDSTATTDSTKTN